MLKKVKVFVNIALVSVGLMTVIVVIATFGHLMRQSPSRQILLSLMAIASGITLFSTYQAFRLIPVEPEQFIRTEEQHQKNREGFQEVLSEFEVWENDWKEEKHTYRGKVFFLQIKRVGWCMWSVRYLVGLAEKASKAGKEDPAEVYFGLAFIQIMKIKEIVHSIDAALERGNINP